MSRRILIADDHVPTRRDLQAFFQQQGFEVVAVGNGDLAARRAGEMRPDLVVLDVLMPGKTGYEACRHIKQVLKLELPVLMIHHDGEPFDRGEALRVGADETLVKPIDPFALLETVNSLWRKYGRTPIGFESGEFVEEVREEDVEAVFGGGSPAEPPPADGMASVGAAPVPEEAISAATNDAPPTSTTTAIETDGFAQTSTATPMATPTSETTVETAPAAAPPPTTPTMELPDPYSVVASGDYAAYFNEGPVVSPSQPEQAAVVSSPPEAVPPPAAETVVDQALPFTDPYPSVNLFAPIPTQAATDVSFSVPERITAELPPPDPAAGLSIKFDTGNAAVHIGGLYEVTEVELPENNTQEIQIGPEAAEAPSATFDEADVSSDGVSEEVALLQETGTDILAGAVIVAVTPPNESAPATVAESSCPHCGGRVLESDILCPHCGEML